MLELTVVIYNRFESQLQQWMSPADSLPPGAGCVREADLRGSQASEARCSTTTSIREALDCLSRETRNLRYVYTVVCSTYLTG